MVNSCIVLMQLIADAGQTQPEALYCCRTVWGFMRAAPLVFADALAQRAAAFPVQKHMAFLGDSEAQKARMPLFALSSVL